MPEGQDGSNPVTRDVNEPSDANVSRRRVLRIGGGAIAGSAAASGNASAAVYIGDSGVSTEPATVEEEEEDGPGPLGGGEGYDDVVQESDADVVVETREELGDALEAAQAGDVVYVAGDASIYLGESTFRVPEGVTLASDRGVEDAPGGHLHTDAETTVFDVHADARVAGIRLQGPFYEYFDPSWYATGTGLRALGEGVEIDNCEVWGFAYASINAQGDAHVHHSEIHHNARDGLGYGVVASGGHPVIEWNYFDHNRHSVASTGSHHGYDVRYNHFGKEAAGIVVDIHSPAGVHSTVHNNIVQAVEDIKGKQDPLQAIQVRGVPDEAYEIYDNWFFNPRRPRDSPAGGWTNEAIIQPTETAWRNVEFEDNYYGEDADVSPSDVIPGYLD